MNLLRQPDAIRERQIQIVQRQIRDCESGLSQTIGQLGADRALTAALAATNADDERPLRRLGQRGLNRALDQVSSAESGCTHATRLGGSLPAKKLSRLSAICMPIAVR